MSAATANAWLLPVAHDVQVAVADCEMIEYSVDATTRPVPLCRAHADQLRIWRGEAIPVFDFPALLGKAPHEPSALATLAYQTEPGTRLQHIAVRLYGIPARIEVSDDQACRAPGDFPPALVLCCFEFDEHPVPVLDTRELARFAP